MPITAVTLSPDSKVLALGTANNKLALFQIDSRESVKLSDELLQAMQSKLTRLPGSLSGLSFIPGLDVSPLLALKSYFLPIELPCKLGENLLTDQS